MMPEELEAVGEKGQIQGIFWYIKLISAFMEKLANSKISQRLFNHLLA